MALEKKGLPTVTLISCSFFSLGQAVGRQLDYPGLPIILLPHPIGDTDLEKVRDKGRDAAEEVVRLLTTHAEAVAHEYMTREFPIPEYSVAKF